MFFLPSMKNTFIIYNSHVVKLYIFFEIDGQTRYDMQKDGTPWNSRASRSHKLQPCLDRRFALHILNYWWTHSFLDLFVGFPITAGRLSYPTFDITGSCMLPSSFPRRFDQLFSPRGHTVKVTTDNFTGWRQTKY